MLAGSKLIYVTFRSEFWPWPVSSAGLRFGTGSLVHRALAPCLTLPLACPYLLPPTLGASFCPEREGMILLHTPPVNSSLGKHECPSEDWRLLLWVSLSKRGCRVTEIDPAPAEWCDAHKHQWWQSCRGHRGGPSSPHGGGKRKL